jgi:hypothetical protein
MKRIAIGLALFVLLALCVTSWPLRIYEDWRDRKRLTPPASVQTFDDFLAWSPRSAFFTSHTHGGKTFVAAYVHRHGGGMLVDGDAVYMFDDTGVLVDWCLDDATDEGFSGQWACGSGKCCDISQEQALELCGVTLSEAGVEVRRTLGEKTSGGPGLDPRFMVNYDLVISEGSQETVVALRKSVEPKVPRPTLGPFCVLHAALVQHRAIWVLVSEVEDAKVMRFRRGEEPGTWTLAASKLLRTGGWSGRPTSAEFEERDGKVILTADYPNSRGHVFRLAATPDGIDIESLSRPK